MTSPCATLVREDASTLVRVLEAHVETLKAENEILRPGSPPPRRGRRKKPPRRKGRSPSFRPL